MARRPERRKDDVLTRDELQELQQRLSHFSIIAVEDFYRSAPSSMLIAGSLGFSVRAHLQELVQAWKMVRKLRSK
jgi:hypothetical protein